MAWLEFWRTDLVPAGPKEISPEQEAALVEEILHGIPNISPATVQRIWQKHHFQPQWIHLLREHRERILNYSRAQKLDSTADSP
jgi:hypothetical protein